MITPFVNIYLSFFISLFCFPSVLDWFRWCGRMLKIERVANVSLAIYSLLNYSVTLEFLYLSSFRDSATFVIL